MIYRNFTLDKFQEDAIKAIEQDHSVVVSAATGTGKTLIADYVINKAIEEGVRAVYTAPIKALSNQKYREFKELYGSKVGMLTGDVVINPGADILIMTTEIYRNMLVEKSPDVAQIKYVIFDEIHFINDIERGTVWEESIIFSPNEVRFLCLSATIPNYRQFADWISSIKEHTVDTVNYMKRAVPLNHQFYDSTLGITTIENIKSQIDHLPKVSRQDSGRGGRSGHGGRGGNKQRSNAPLPNHTELIKELEESGKLPAIFFSFSRNLCEKRAKELAKKKTFTTPDQRKFIVEFFNDHMNDSIKNMHSTRELKEVIVKGIGVHHAGMLPKLKEIVELLFDKGLISVLYATETFAVGINMPAKTVCFGSLEKYDGISFRLLNSKEYFQLAGRAGRRGIDTVGYAISLIDRNHPENLPKIAQLVTGDTEPIISRYNLSYNTILNLRKHYDDAQIQVLLKSNFGYFVKKQNQNQVRILQSFSNYERILEKLGFLENKKVTWKGEFATRIYTRELEVGELVYSGILAKMNLKELGVVLASLIYEERRMDEFDIEGVDIGPILKKLKDNQFLDKKVKKIALKKMHKIVNLWLSGASFEKLLDVCNLAEGDIIRLFRQLIDMSKQILSSLKVMQEQDELQHTLSQLIAAIDRDLIAVEL
jgi:superfamily II RNA helicase